MGVSLFLAGVVGYFLFVAVIACILVATRGHAWLRSATLQQSAAGRADAKWHLARAQLHDASWAVYQRLRHFTSFAGSRWLGLGLAAAIAAALPPSAYLMRQIHAYDGYDETTAARREDARITRLLQGELLVAPTPLPPALFAGGDVEEAYPLAVQASRDWQLLDASFRQRLLLAYRLMEQRHGYRMVLIEGYRSPARQDQLAALGTHVTRARANQSYHQFGLAADSAFLRQGRVVVSERDPWAMAGYRHFGEVAREVGLTWGGDWKSIQDYGHVELRRPIANGD